MTRDWTEETVAAFLDGELDGEEAERMAHIIETDGEAQAVAERIREQNRLLREAFDAPMREEAPPAMRAVVEAASRVTPLASRRRRGPAKTASWAPMAMAASVALAVGLGAGFSLAPRGAVTGAPGVGGAGPALAAALESAPSGVAQNGVRPLASFPVTGGGVCREFETAASGEAPAAFGLACREPDGWRVLAAVAATAGNAPPPSDGFAPASGAAVDAIAPLLDALGAGVALDAAAEQAAIEAGWR